MGNENIQKIKQLLLQLNVAPLKRYGQNFMVDDTFVNQIKDYVFSKYDGKSLIEVGPGLGSLTIPLLTKYDLFAIEIDRKYSEYLSSLHINHLKVLQGNALKYDFPETCALFSNMPYYISTELVEHAIIHSDHIQQAFLLGQREFVQKLFAKPSEEGYGPLTVLVHWAGTAQLVLDVPYQAFYPEPGVVSTFFHLKFKPGLHRETNYRFFLFIKKIFNNRRKTILNNLEHVTEDRNRAEDILNQLGISTQLRPEQLNPQQFIQIFHQL